MTEMTELFLGTYDTLRGVKKAIDGELDTGDHASPPDDATLERLLSLSRLHAAMTRKLQDMMLDQGASPDLQAEVQLLREAYENTQSEIALRLWTRRGRPMPSASDPSEPFDHEQRAEDGRLGEDLGQDEEADLLQQAFQHTKRLFALQLRARRERSAHGGAGSGRRLRRDQEQRLRADAAVRVFHRDAGYQVELIEVTSTGVRLRPTNPLPAGARVTLRCLHLSVRASVEYSGDRTASLQFRTPLTSSELQTLRDAAGGKLSGASGPSGLLPNA